MFSGNTSESSIWNNGYWFNGLWVNGTFNNGYFGNGIWRDGIYNRGQVGRDIDRIDDDLAIVKRPYTYEDFLGISYTGTTTSTTGDVGGTGGGEGSPIYWGIHYANISSHDLVYTNEEIFAAMSDNPIIGQIKPRLARKKSSLVFSFLLLYILTPTTTPKNAIKVKISSQLSCILTP